MRLWHHVSVRLLAYILLAATLAYNVAEGFLTIIAGIEARSVVLLSFGADSYVEVLAAAAVIWRLSYRDDEAGERAEQRATRLIGATFLALAVATVFQSIYSLASRQGADESLLGVVVLAASLVLMPPLFVAKFWVAARTSMPVLAAEAKETVACSYLTITAMAGVLAVFLVGWWWLDAVGALLLVPWFVKEGREGIRAEACFEGVRPCFCGTCLFGLRSCTPVCCTPACC